MCVINANIELKRLTRACIYYNEIEGYIRNYPPTSFFILTACNRLAAIPVEQTSHQYCATIADGGPTSKQHWIDVSCFPRSFPIIHIISTQPEGAAHSHQKPDPENKIPAQCWDNVADGGPTSNQHWIKASCLLGDLEVPASHTEVGDLALKMTPKTTRESQVRPPRPCKVLCASGLPTDTTSQPDLRKAKPTQNTPNRDKIWQNNNRSVGWRVVSF